MKNQVVRIIGGKFRGRKLRFPEIPGLRPTSDRVRETLFNWLMHDLTGAAVLDAFAGSGALGFEAASRGAGEVVMVEASKIAFKALEQQTKAWQMNQVTLLNQDALAFLAQTQHHYDFIFLDPPFESNLLQQAIDLIHQTGCLHPAGKVYIETRRDVTFNPGNLSLSREKKAGQVRYQLWSLT